MERLQREAAIYAAPEDKLILRIEPAEGDKPRRLVGYAAVYNSLSKDLGGFRERILPGAFSRALSSGDDIRCLVDHDFRKILGRTSNGTLRLTDDEIGLRIECDIPDVSYARDLVVQVERRDIRGMSFGALAKKSGVRVKREDGGIVQELVELDRLSEVSATSIPAYTGTELMVRAEPALLGEIPGDSAARLKLVLRKLSLR